MAGTTVTPQDLYLKVKNLVMSTLRGELESTSSLVEGFENAYKYMVHLLGDDLPKGGEETLRVEVESYFHTLNLHRVEHWTKKINVSMVEVASLTQSLVLKEIQELLAADKKADIHWINKAIRAVNVQLPALKLYSQLLAQLSGLKNDKHVSVVNAKTALAKFVDNESWISQAEKAKSALETYLTESRLGRESGELKQKLRNALSSFRPSDDRVSIVRARELVRDFVARKEWVDEAAVVYARVYALMVGDEVGEKVLDHWAKILPKSVPYPPVDNLFKAFEDWVPTMEWARSAEMLMKILRKAGDPTCPVCKKAKLKRLDGGKGKYPEKCSDCDLPVIKTLPVATDADQELAAFEAKFNVGKKKQKKGKGKGEGKKSR